MNTHTDLGPLDEHTAPISRPIAGVLASDFVTLAKPRITVMVLATALGGLFMAPVRASWSVAAWTMLGTVLIVAGANALNMYVERDSDRFMSRTKDRPLPAGRMAPWMALVFGVGLSVLALPILTLGAHPVTAALAVFANLSYVFVYTPLKARSWTAVLVGAVPGAIPPVLGYTAATGALDLAALSLFAIMFVWQVPHFHAIALFRQEEYARAGLKVLPNVRGVPTTKLHIVTTTLLLAIVSLEPWWLGVVSNAYPIAVLVLDAVFLGWAVAGLRDGAGVRWARSFFAASMPWLVLVFALLLATKR